MGTPRALLAIALLFLGGSLAVLFVRGGASGDGRPRVTAPGASGSERSDLREPDRPVELELPDTSSDRLESPRRETAVEEPSVVDPRQDWEAYVLVQPRLSSLDDAFEEKYAGATDDQIRAAALLILSQIDLDIEEWMPRRIANGDYEDVSDARPIVNTLRKRVLTGVIKHMEIGGEIRTLQFMFDEERYPWVHYRARENQWIANEMHRRKITE